MPSWLQLDWQRIFVPSEPILEIAVRGTIMYLATFALLRVFRRQAGSLGPADLLVLLFVADAAQNGMADDYQSVTEGLMLIGTIMGWEYVLDWLGFRWPWFQAVVERSPLLLIDRGEIKSNNLKRELMTVDELMSHLRQKGIDDVAQVRICCLEGDGHISVIAANGENSSQGEEPEQRL